MIRLFTATFVVVLNTGICLASPATDTPMQLIAPAVAYQPRGYAPGQENAPQLKQQIVEDLRLLREAGFRSLVTYGSLGVLAEVPRLARREGFDGTIIMGLWDPASQLELQNAAAQAEHVDGYAVGNEGLARRYDTSTLGSAMEWLRASTGLPVTTTEPIDGYLAGPNRKWLLDNSDWLFPLAHPFWAVHFDPERATDWIIARHDYLVATTGRSVILKEVGFPSLCDEGCDAEQQKQLFRSVESAGLRFFYFEAFDQPWKPSELKFGEAEAHWGLFDVRGNPKAVIAWLKGRQGR